MTTETKIPDGFAERTAAAGGVILDPAADGIPAARVDAGSLLSFLSALKEGPGARFDMLVDLCGVDEYPKEPRFDVVYHLRSLKTGEMVRVKAFAAEKTYEIPSVAALYPTADWHEREAFDMMGIVFAGHPGLKRILMPLEYEHHPLRKDFPLEGIEPDKLFKKRFPRKSIGSMHQKRLDKGAKGS